MTGLLDGWRTLVALTASELFEVNTVEVNATGVNAVGVGQHG